jgi:lysophospholipase L1-like esterase
MDVHVEEDAAAAAKGRTRSRTVPYLLLAGVLFGCFAELTARAQDWFSEGTPFWSAPSSETSLFMSTPEGRRGRPYGHYRQWRLNAYGFRSPEISALPAPAMVRIVVLGASETFGLYESPDHEYPAQLSRVLDRTHFEVVNAALPGMTLRSARTYYKSWVSQFHPSVVIVYPSPMFYLNAVAPGDPAPSVATPRASRPTVELSDRILSMRMVQRLRDLIDFPDSIQRWRDRRAIDSALRGQPADWVFQTTPDSRLQRFMRDLSDVAACIRDSGATVVLVTHATRVSDPPTSDDQEYLWRARVNTPRAAPEVIAAFESATNASMRAWASEHGVELVDAASILSGKKLLFADLVHFTDAGAHEMALALGTHIRDETPEADRTRGSQ